MNRQLKTNTTITASSDKPSSSHGGLKQHLCRLISIQVDNLLANSNSNHSSVYQIDEAFEAADDYAGNFCARISHPLV